MIRVKPKKLRAACNQCHATKVKCSGEKSGCHGCVGRGIECSYAESRVGRVPGTRRKNMAGNANAIVAMKNMNTVRRVTGSPADESTGIVENTENPVAGVLTNARLPLLPPRTSEDPGTCIGETTDLEYSSSNTPGSQLAGVGSTGIFDDVLVDWTTVFDESLDATYSFDERYADDILSAPQDAQPKLSRQQQSSVINQAPDYHEATSLPRLPLTTSGLESPSVESGYHRLGTQNNRFPPPRSAATTSPQMVTTDSERNSRCVIACSQIIGSLERYQVDQLKTLDLVLGIVKRVTERLEPLINGQFGIPNAKCVALLNVILHQLVETLEAGCAGYFADASDAQQPLFSGLLESGVQELDFGGLGTGYRYQERLRSQVVLDVLRPVFEAMQTVLFIARSAGLDGDSCHRDNESRLTVLKEKVKERGGICESP